MTAPTRNCGLTLAADETTRLAETFRLLGDTTRLSILLCCLAGPRAVGEISDLLGQSQSLVSHHLRLLRAARLVRGERRARQVFYSLSDRHVSDMLHDMAHHIAEERAETAALTAEGEVK
ncbi:ArsR/SmtB family transcription factor [Paracoccus aminophilus]|uniref:Transcriptional regulator, ArsR family n=1 Tax=Paracoccus aminophilus JCM 7686 TaxID=1367847 RepID=S5Z0Z3_PARAH|nr:metalloregulator ArsR/SmtB family transcription factor [Paracoccus aminophilus]AGT11091.1 transcriptional regulator, ArsR family [Paracoccus aminophilus JCM 7686]